VTKKLTLHGDFGAYRSLLNLGRQTCRYVKVSKKCYFRDAKYRFCVSSVWRNEQS